MTLQSQFGLENDWNVSDSEPKANFVPMFESRFNFAQIKGRKVHPHDNNMYMPESTNFVSKINPGSKLSLAFT